MAITISTTTIAEIDATYPVAGQDNDSQGFRDNFTAIKNTLTATATDLETLNETTAQGVSYNSAESVNNFNGTVLTNADMKANTEFVKPSDNITSSQNISFSNGHYQIFQIGDDVTLTLADWPESGKMGKIRLQITSDSDVLDRTITWAVQGGGEIYNDGNALWSDFRLTAGDYRDKPGKKTLIIDFWSVDGGSSVFGSIVGEFIKP